MGKLNGVDITVCLFCVLLVPVVVKQYLRSPQFSRQFREFTIIGGMLWMAYSLINEDYIYGMLGVWRADSSWHWTMAMRAGEELNRGHWPFALPIPYSNSAYQALLAISHHLTGVSWHGITTVNALFSFMGGLTLARAFRNCVPTVRVGNTIWWLIIFFPSVVFWTTANLKEGLVYWGICQMLSALPAMRTRGVRGLSVPFFLGGLIVHILRPHILLIWLAGFASAAVLQSRNRIVVGAILLVAVPMCLFGLRQVTKKDFSSTRQIMEQLQTRHTDLDRGTQGSHIQYGEEGPIFLVSGLTCIFFRPFPWKINSLRVAISALETWALTILIVLAWLKADRADTRRLLRNPLVQATIVATLLFSVLFTHLPNEGLIARQRIQLVPGLLSLALLPMMITRYSRLMSTAQRWIGGAHQNYRHKRVR